MTNNQRSETPKEDIIDFKSQVAKAVKDLQNRISQLEVLPSGSVEVKSTTGDFTVAESYDGRLVLNTVDNNIKVFENAVWRTITSW